MSHPATSQFLDGLLSSRLLDETRIDELRSRPEATWGDVSSLSNYAQERGWLTAYQARELQEGRGDQLTVHGYRIFDKVDEGPGGITYKALHPALQQPVSLRLLRPEWLSPADSESDYVARAQAASLAQSPHLANVLDAGTLDGGPFVVQEYVDGCDLFRLVNEMGGLPLGLACEYVRQAAIALKTAHNCGVAHGEISPHAMLLTPVKRVTGANGDQSIRPRPGATIKLTDLGLVPRRPPVGELTYGQSDRIGAIAFYPPERLTNGERTRAGDCYGLGATLYFLLTTRPPHAGDSPLAVMLNLQQAEPAPLETLQSGLPAVVTDLVRRLLSRDPNARPSAADVAQVLIPYCEPSAKPPAAADDMGGVLIAHETFTQPLVPTAVPVARDLEHAELQPDAGPFAEPVANAIEPLAEAPLVEPLPEAQPLHHDHNGQILMPEIQPLEDHHDGASSDHLNAFGHSALGTGAPRTPRPKTKATGKNKTWIMIGLCLHLIGVILLIGLLTNWFASSRTPDPSEHKPGTTKEPNKSRGKQ